MSLSLYERIYGCLLGGACGDALGAPVEFLSDDQIASHYGPEGITQFDRAYGVFGAITDDTQMTLFTVEGLIRAAVRFASRGICHPPGVVHQAYRRWLATQDKPFESQFGNDELDGWLIREKRLWARRAPGNTCLSSLRSGGVTGEPAPNNSKGCGTVMRDAPFGFVGVDDPWRAFGYALEAAQITHGHPSARFSSGALAIMIAFILRGSELEHAVHEAIATLSNQDGAHEVEQALRQSLRLSRDADWRKRLPELGAGWIAEEALAIAVLCALAGETPRHAIVAAVNHSGDSDSTGAITGNIMGAMHGPAALPSEWVEPLELRDVIETLATDIAAVLEGRVDPQELWERYPGW